MTNESIVAELQALMFGEENSEDFLTSTQIGEHMGLTQKTTRGYLNIAKKMGRLETRPVKMENLAGVTVMVPGYRVTEEK